MGVGECGRRNYVSSQIVFWFYLKILCGGGLVELTLLEFEGLIDADNT